MEVGAESGEWGRQELAYSKTMRMLGAKKSHIGTHILTL